MIKLKAGDRGFVDVDWEGILSLPGYRTPLDLKSRSFQEVLGTYIVPEAVACGLANCRTPHRKGYIVSMTDGLLTNIGHDCGSTHLGLVFKDAAAQIVRDIEAQAHREQITTFLDCLPEARRRIDTLRQRPFGADWAHPFIERLSGAVRGCPAEVTRELRRMAKESRSALVRTRPATDEERKSYEVANNRSAPRDYSIEETVASIAGIEALRPENDLRDLLINRWSEPLRQFDAFDAAAADERTLRRLARLVGDLRPLPDQVASIVAACRRLISKTNLTPLEELAQQPESREQFRKFLREVDRSAAAQVRAGSAERSAVVEPA